MILPITNYTQTLNIAFKSQTATVGKPSRRTRAHIENKRAAQPVSHVPITPVNTTIEKSKYSYNIFKAKLDSIFYNFTSNSSRNPKNSIGQIEFNSERYKNGIDYIKSIKLKSGIQAREYINENNLISARIILDKGTKAEGNRALARLQKAIKDRRIIVREIGLYGVNENTDYAGNNMVNGILEESNELGFACKKITNRKANGYHSLVAKIQLEDGFIGTLEVMGKEVAKLKDVEDILHSIEKGTHVDSKYGYLEKEYLKLSEEQKARLKSYTKAAYLEARANELFGTSGNNFLPLTDSNLSTIFDFNNIAKI